MTHKVSICIPCHNQAHLLGEAIASALKQNYRNIEIIVLDDASKDSPNLLGLFAFREVKYYRSPKPSGSGGAFNKAMEYATGDYIVFLCADDIFTDKNVIGDIVNIFKSYKNVAHVSRYYYQFIDGNEKVPVRAWRCNDIIELANNPSGLAFRKSAIGNNKLTNKMFVEAPAFVYGIMKNKGNLAMIMPWDTVAVRIHKSTARSRDYYKKMWTSSPIEEWRRYGGKHLLKDYTSLIQIKNYFTTQAVLKECWNFIKYRPVNLLAPGFWFFAIVAILTPRFILYRLPEIYRATFGKWTTKIICRP